MSRRAIVLEQLGLTPIYRRRDSSVAQAQDSPAADGADVTHDELKDVPATPASRGDVASMDWVALKSAVTVCTNCGLHKGRHQAVLGVGDEGAEWLFVGEGPGAEEDQRGEPFVGQAGKLLDAMLAAIGLQRGQNVYIANVVKCRPPGNRTPAPEEAAACGPYLARQIALVRPKLIVALGKVAAQHLLGREATIASLRGHAHRVGDIPLLVTYHPAYLLRNLTDKARAWEDLCLAVETMRTLKEAAANPK